MKKNIQIILKELYSLDPTLKKGEKNLIKIIEHFQKSKPNIKINEEFLEELKSDLRKKRVQLTTPKKNLWEKISHLFLPFSTGIAVALILVTIVQNDPFNNHLSERDTNFNQKTIQSLPEKAFGPISFHSEETPEASSMPSLSEDLAIPKREPLSIPYEPKNYEFIYQGKPIDLSEKKIKVYRKNEGKIPSSNLVNILESFDFGLINLESLKNITIENIQLSEDRKFGYRVDINFSENQISIYQNWNKWPDPNEICHSKVNELDCYEKNQLKPEDLPQDEEVIKIANQFLSQYGIEKNNYGSPIIQKDWEREIIAFKEDQISNDFIYIPENLKVIYPYQIEGKAVYNESGYPMGLNIDVNIRYKRVSGLNNLKIEEYESSDYPAVTDWKKIEKYLKSGAGMHHYPQNEKVSIEIKNAEEVLMSKWKYDEKSNKGRYYYTPAIRFSVESKNNPLHREYIMIPLAAELFESNDQRFPVEPMPYN